MARNPAAVSCFAIAIGLAACGRNDSADRQRIVEVPAQTDLYLGIDRSLDSAKTQVGDVVSATLESAVVAGGREAIPKGTKFLLRVTNSQVAREKGTVGLLTLQVESFRLNGREQEIRSLPVTEQTPPLREGVRTPGIPREDQARANAVIPANRVILFVTTDAFRL